MATFAREEMNVVMIEVRGLTKRYGRKLAIQDVSFAIGQNEIVGLLGLNGAGKSTTMNIISGYIGPTSGDVRIGDCDILQDSRRARALVGYLPEQPPLYGDMTVEEYLRFVERLYRRRADRAHMDRVLEMTGLSGVRGRLIRNLSKGYRQRVGVAQAILPEPRVLVLDEPCVGLDPTQIIEMRTLIRTVSQEMTVILSSHILTEIQAVCSRVLVLNEGRLIADDSPEHLASRMHGRRRTQLRVQGEMEEIRAALANIPGVTRIECAGQREYGSWDFSVEAAGERDVRVDAFEALSAAHLPILTAGTGEGSLECAFIELLEGGEGRDTA